MQSGLSLLEKAAEQGSPSAFNAMGYLYIRVCARLENASIVAGARFKH